MEEHLGETHARSVIEMQIGILSYSRCGRKWCGDYDGYLLSRIQVRAMRTQQGTEEIIPELGRI